MDRTGTGLELLSVFRTGWEGNSGYGMTFEALLRSVIFAITNEWISLAILKTQARAKLRAKLAPLALQRRSYGFPTMS